MGIILGANPEVWTDSSGTISFQCSRQLLSIVAVAPGEAAVFARDVNYAGHIALVRVEVTQ
ncbi:MAG: hypothetical protein AB1445_05780 [Bacillota bacterium]